MTDATETPAEPATDPKIIAAREALAKRYEERGFTIEPTWIRAGSWDNEPFMLALVDIQP